MGKKEKSLNQKLAEINSLWDNVEVYVEFMPDREMIHLEDDESANLLDSIYLDDNTDWLAWELELME